jgi:hypothetical protein
MFVYAYIFSQYREVGWVKEILKIGTAVSAMCYRFASPACRVALGAMLLEP